VKKNVKVIAVLLLMAVAKFAFAQQTSNPVAAGALELPNPANIIPISVAGKPKMEVIVYRRLRNLKLDDAGVFKEGFFCSTKSSLRVSPLTAEQFSRAISASFIEQSKLAGYPQMRESTSAFDTGTSNKFEFELGAVLKDANLDFCFNSSRLNGTMKLNLTFEVFSHRLQRVVFTRDTVAFFQSKDSETYTAQDFYRKAVDVAVRTLLSDPQYVAILGGSSEIAADAPAKSLLKVQGARALEGGVAKNMLVLRSGVVTIETAKGSGTGFYISRDGYLLTNYHVVGDSPYVKVRLANGREVVAEVLKSDQTRDVALLKSEAIRFEALSVLQQEVNIGDEVYAIGSPLGRNFEGSVTKGIVSGFPALNQAKFLQSDALIAPGSSGGPLINKDGMVVGIAVGAFEGGRPSPATSTVRLNLFVPINEAIEKLGITFDLKQ
jgi:serine protease Do